VASFCRACCLELFHADLFELAGLTPMWDWLNGKAQVVLCEGCGVIQVDPAGNCVSPGCLRAGQPGHGMPWVSEAMGIQSALPASQSELQELRLKIHELKARVLRIVSRLPLDIHTRMATMRNMISQP
jgi:hypothetical protein